MFENISLKLKFLAKIVLWCGLILTATVGVIIFDGDIDNFFETAFNVTVGLLATLTASFLLYGFGETIDRLRDIDCSGADIRSDAQKNIDRKRLYVIEKLRLHDLITEKEYSEIIKAGCATHISADTFKKMKKLQTEYERAAISEREYRIARADILNNP